MAKILDGGYNFCLNPFEQEIVGHFFTLILLQGEREESTQMLPQIKNFQEKIFISLEFPEKSWLDVCSCILKKKQL